jgi:hypothetical protein
MLVGRISESKKKKNFTLVYNKLLRSGEVVLSNVKSGYKNSFRKLVSVTVTRTVVTNVIGTFYALRHFFFRNSFLSLEEILI